MCIRVAQIVRIWVLYVDCLFILINYQVDWNSTVDNSINNIYDFKILKDGINMIEKTVNETVYTLSTVTHIKKQKKKKCSASRRFCQTITSSNVTISRMPDTIF